MNMNPTAMRLLQMIRSGGNPQQLVLSMLQSNAQNNPMIQNLLSLVNQGKSADIESVARNMLKSQGFDFDKEFGNFKQTLGIK